MAAEKFPCTNCGYRLEFEPGAGMVKCSHCGNENPVPKPREDVTEQDFFAHLSQAEQQEEFVEEQTVRCDSCGAAIKLDPIITTSRCPFCGAPMHAEAETNRLIKPKSLLPFKIAKNQLDGLIRQWAKTLRFVPGKLTKHAKVDEDDLRGIYIPYWTFDAVTMSNYFGARGHDYKTTEEYRTQNKNGQWVTKTRQVTQTRWKDVSGVVNNSFNDVLVLASNSLPRKMTSKLEPWDLNNLVPYQVEYLSGFQAEAYQIGLEESYKSAKEKMDNKIEAGVKFDIGGSRQRIYSIDTHWFHVSFKHTLLPIWTGVYRYKKKGYRFLVNGRTGEVQGKRPWAIFKILRFIFAILGVCGFLALVFFWLAGQIEVPIFDKIADVLEDLYYWLRMQFR